MSPRAYNLGKREAASQQTRARIIAATRRLLSAPEGIAALTLDAVAREASVARMTLYYQFGSKRGLLEALYDDLAAQTLARSVPAAFHETDAVLALEAFVGAFTSFWASDRLIIGRLRAMGVLDPDVGEGIRARDSRRRGIFGRVVAWLAGGSLDEQAASDLLESLLVLTSFEAFNVLAEAAGDEAAQRITRDLVHGLFGRAGIAI